MIYSLFVSCPRGLEYLLEEEMRFLGLAVTRVSPQGVFGDTDIKGLYRICLWSRLANRVQLILFKGEANDAKALHRLCQRYPWQDVFTLDKSFAVEFHGESSEFRNAMFGAQVVKDGIVDYFRQQADDRPTVDKQQPDIRLHAFLKHPEITVSLDLNGYSLHQRGYRLRAGDAPLKENLAAAMLLRAQWPQLAEQGYALADPMCGSGTLVIEAALMAANIAPGLLRNDQSFQHWQQHQPDIWQAVRLEAEQARQTCSQTFYGSDQNAQLIDIAVENAQRAGVSEWVQFETLPLEQFQSKADKGLIISNPPYGERMGEVTQLIPLYRQLGERLAGHFQGWRACILTNNPLLAKAIGLRAFKQYSLFNGPLACKLYCLEIDASNQFRESMGPKHSEALQGLSNRLKKNWQHLRKWAKRSGVHAFRLYDADLPEYAFAVDWYDGYVVLQEYAAPPDVPEHKAQRRSLEMVQLLPEILAIDPQRLIVKERRQQKGTNQYQKLEHSAIEHVIIEGEARLKVNLSDYLDTGLFLDHRPLRLQFARLPANSRLLNCFCYTATASVHAALAGVLTTNVDLSNTYLRWGQENFQLNELDLHRHQFIQFDCMEWLSLCKDRFDTIFLDPPSFSNSKRMQQTLDVQRDHEQLIHAAMRLLNPGGILYFSTNLRSFKLAGELGGCYAIKDISLETIPEDFKRDPKMHRCYALSSLDSTEPRP